MSQLTKYLILRSIDGKLLFVVVVTRLCRMGREHFLKVSADRRKPHVQQTISLPLTHRRDKADSERFLRATAVNYNLELKLAPIRRSADCVWFQFSLDAPISSLGRPSHLQQKNSSHAVNQVQLHNVTATHSALRSDYKSLINRSSFSTCFYFTINDRSCDRFVNANRSLDHFDNSKKSNNQ